jgi:uncharacterized membrane protein
MSNKKKMNDKKQSPFFILSVFMVVIVVGVLFMKNNKASTTAAENETNTAKAQISESGDLIIPVDSVSGQASYYEYDANGTKLEVIAIQASDGSIRTAFNTCQVCFSSGRGYYVQEGDKLVCQNCGNRFAADDVEIVKGGCNPVPISTDYKTVDETNITISKEFLDSANVLFEKWKS